MRVSDGHRFSEESFYLLLTSTPNQDPRENFLGLLLQDKFFLMLLHLLVHSLKQSSIWLPNLWKPISQPLPSLCSKITSHPGLSMSSGYLVASKLSHFLDILRVPFCRLTHSFKMTFCHNGVIFVCLFESSKSFSFESSKSFSFITERFRQLNCQKKEIQ